MKEELTSLMHSEFSVSTETDRKHTVFSALVCMYEFGYTEEEVCDEYEVTPQDIGRYRTEYEGMQA